MKVKKSLVIALSAVTVISACSMGVVALNQGNEPAAKTYSSDYTNMTDEELEKAIAEKNLPMPEYTEEEKQQLIEQRKAERRRYRGLTDEERLEVCREDAAANGRLEYFEKTLAEQESYWATEKGSKEKAEMDEYNAYCERIAAEKEKAAIELVENAGYYPEGVDTVQLAKEEDYSLEFICNVCHAYSEHKGESSSGANAKVVEYLNDCYDEITTWFPQSEKSMETYETIENTIKVRFYSTSVERR